MTDSISADGRAVIQAAIIRAGLFALLWWILTEGELGYWGLAVLIIVITTVSSLALMPTGIRGWRISGFIRFIPYFLRQTARGSIDVARRALDPRLPLAPTYIDYRMRLRGRPEQVFLSSVLSLLPGTLSVDLRETELHVHVLDERMPVRENVRELEDVVAGLFGIDLDDT